MSKTRFYVFVISPIMCSIFMNYNSHYRCCDTYSLLLTLALDVMITARYYEYVLLD